MFNKVFLHTRSIFYLIGLFVFLVSCAVNGGCADTGPKRIAEGRGGTLTVVISMGPISPVQKLGSPSSRPYPGVKVNILRLDKEENARSAVTDQEGKFTISLSPGIYRVELPPSASALGHYADTPSSLVITEGNETKLDIYFDTGLRQGTVSGDIQSAENEEKNATFLFSM